MWASFSPLPATAQEGIVFDQVSFRYPGSSSDKNVLHDVSFTAPLGQLTDTAAASTGHVVDPTAPAFGARVS